MVSWASRACTQEVSVRLSSFKKHNRELPRRFWGLSGSIAIARKVFGAIWSPPQMADHEPKLGTEAAAKKGPARE